MKQHRIALLLLLVLVSLGACSPGHLGSNVITFIRDGQLWTIDPDGANAFAVVAQQTPPVISYSWSPTHQILAFRTLDGDFAKTPAARHLPTQAITSQIGDVPSAANTIGVDGGTPITIAFSSPDIQYSNAMWNSNGTRLLYRATGQSRANTPYTASWWVAQNDQPGGIASKSLPSSYTIPSLSYVTQNYQAIGNTNSGVFTTTIAGTNERWPVRAPLPGHPLPASLERILWQPAHQDQSFLYAISTTPAGQPLDQSPLIVQLLLRSLNGHTTKLATCTCTQFAWSPDGQYVLYSTGSIYTVFNVQTSSSFNIVGESDSVPYWSPDSHFLLLDGSHSLILATTANKQQKVLLSDGTGSAATGTTSANMPGMNALLQPVANSIWAADSRHFLFLTRNRLQWQGQKLAGKGLYTATIDDSGRAQGTPAVVDTGNDTQAGWTYQDANTSFLY